MGSTDLHQTTVVSGNDEFAIRADAAAAGDILEAGYCFCYLLGARGIYLDPCSGGDRESVRFAGGKVDGGNGRIFLYEYGVLELAPVTRLWAVLGGGRTRVRLHDHWLVAHLKKLLVTRRLKKISRSS